MCSSDPHLSTSRRATRKDPAFAPAWMALGHSFAAIGDHDQAIAAYARVISKIDPLSVPANLAVAAEYQRARKFVLAGPYINSAYAVAPTDPHVLNELGTLFFARGDLARSLDVLEAARAAAATPSGGVLPPPIHGVLVDNIVVVLLRLAAARADPALLERAIEVSRTAQPCARPRAHSSCAALVLELAAILQEDSIERQILISSAIACLSHSMGGRPLSHMQGAAAGKSPAHPPVVVSNYQRRKNRAALERLLSYERTASIR